MTAQEVSSMLRYGVNPIIVVVNNDGYTIERLLCTDPMDAYNDIAKWDYTKLVEAFEGEKLVLRARTKKEFSEALNSARRTSELVYIEAFTGIMDAPDFACKLSNACSPIVK
jgi:indolepyruvate decarboxylase